MFAHNRMRWLWLAAALLVGGLLTIAGTAPIGAKPIAQPEYLIQEPESASTNRVMAPTAPPNVQVAHLAPFAPTSTTTVTVMVDATTFLTDVTFADSTAYLPVLSGTHLVEIFPAGVATPALTSTLVVTEDQAYTAIAIGGANTWPLALVQLTDTLTPAVGSAKVRVGHLAPFAAVLTDTTADVRLDDDTVILNDVTYGAISDYLELMPGTYDLKITSPDGSIVYIDPLPVTLADGDILSLFAVGDGDNQPLGVYALPSGASGFLLPLAPRVQVAHLAPFAMGTGTAVTVTLDGTAILTDVAFTDSTGYLPVPDGMHEIGLVPAGATSPAITETFTFTPSMDFTLLAIGGAEGWPLDLLQLENNTVPPAPGTLRLSVGHLAPFASALVSTTVDVVVNGTVVLSDVVYGNITNYMALPAGLYDIEVTSPGGGTVYIDPPSVVLTEGQSLSLYAIGDGTNQPLDIFALPDGEPGYLLAELRTRIYMPLIVNNAQP